MIFKIMFGELRQLLFDKWYLIEFLLIFYIVYKWKITLRALRIIILRVFLLKVKNMDKIKFDLLYE